MQDLIKLIERDLHSANAEDCAYAIRVCCLNNITDESIVNSIKELKTSDKIAMMQRISDMAMAALEILDVEKYTGDNPLVLDNISTVFYSKNTADFI